jgi:hypothetical protein
MLELSGGKGGPEVVQEALNLNVQCQLLSVMRVYGYVNASCQLTSIRGRIGF